MSTTAPDRVAEDLERALEGPPARVRDPFTHVFRVPLWRLLSRRAIRPGDVALCGYVASSGIRNLGGRRPSSPVCPRCDVLRRG